MVPGLRTGCTNLAVRQTVRKKGNGAGPQTCAAMTGRFLAVASSSIAASVADIERHHVDAHGVASEGQGRVP